MGFLQSYTTFLIKHPCKLLAIGVSVVLSFLLLTLLLRPLPSFRDPLVGFEARDTLISSRLNAIRLLLDETSASANNLSLSANSNKYQNSYSSQISSQRTGNDQSLNGQDFFTKPPEPPVIEMSTQHVGQNLTPSLVLDEDEDEYYKSINSSLDTSQNLLHYSLGSSKAFCGKLYEGYTQIVVSSTNKYSSSGLFNLQSMLAVCQLDKRLRLEQSPENRIIFQNDCEKFQVEEDTKAQSKETKIKATCCNSWSVPNYIACLNNKTNCMNIDYRDIRNTEHLLNLCAPFYYKAPYEECFNPTSKEKETSNNENIASQKPTLSILEPATHRLNQWTSQPYCGTIPDKCLRCNGWAYIVLNYLTSENFARYHAILGNDTNITAGGGSRPSIPPNKHPNIASLAGRLTHTNIFLPMAKSSSLMRYYQTLLKYSLKTPYAQVKAMDLGLKNSLFEYLISNDARLFIIALVLIMSIISIYTWSFILSFVILIIICLSMCLSYAIYELILDIPVFPFMNLLAIVISFGICSDNAMLFCKYWTLTEGNEEDIIETNGNMSNELNKEKSNEKENLNRMLKRAIISTLVATLATACSFIISAISKVIAVRCFCIFATLSVITNYLLIVLLLPPALIIDSRLASGINKYLNRKGFTVVSLVEYARLVRDNLLRAGATFHKVWVFHIVTKYKLYLIIIFITLLSCSSVLVFHEPTLQISNDEDIQLFSSKHTFEQYDKNLKRQFAFERLKLSETLDGQSTNGLSNPAYDYGDTLPIRVVFGILPADNGNHFDQLDRGSIKFDPNFDMTDPNAQIWLLDFCRKLRQQRFIHPSSAPELTNCFLDTFKSWMDTRSCRDPVQTEIDRSPCCQAYEFPYSRYTFNKCIGEAMHVMRKTPQMNPNPSSGVRFFKNSSKIAAVVIEYQSNRLFSESFTKMERFYNDIDEWISWQINNTAPPSLKSGWFISSNLELLALQTELQQSTMNSILLEVLFAMVALAIGTRDLVLTIAGTLTIGTIIILTVAILILLEWTLGVAESILISLTIGLSIDFALHYSVAYSESSGIRTNDGVINRILDEVGSPIALATTTTSLAGFVIFWSDILAYQQLGVFLMLIALSSWLTSTFFLVPMLATVNAIVENGRFVARLVVGRAFKMLIDGV